ncbi:MAG TPA: TRAP transporter large permease subunit [Burkholderiales bacterium]|nr:TRAP transporter large permease subunit [Burkholderiales bacterium]HVJ23536.1 TRAP transporter large permease subunit [Burkholderiales bacterium]
MGTLAIAAVLIVLLFALLAGGLWIAMAMSVVAYVGLLLFTTSPPEVNLFQAYWGATASWTLAALPLFVWMGEILFRTRLSEEMFEGLAPWLGWLPGRLLHVNILGCGIFAAVSGSSAATCATIGKVALPELRKRGYDERMSLGSLCGAGTLGLLIPPSIIMIVYAVAAEVSILKMFVAGVLPGILLIALFSGCIAVWALLNPEKTPTAIEQLPLRERLHRARNLVPCLALIVFVMATMFTGYATATEAAAFGVLGSLAIAWWSRTLTWTNFRASLMGATRLSCMILFILAGAAFMSSCMAFTGIPRALAEWVATLNMSRYGLLAALVVIYVLLGMVIDGISMIVLTMSIVLPMVQGAGIDLIWFGIFIVILVEIAQITPPVGFNLFVLQTMSGRDINYVARASLPFFFMMLIALGVVIAFPALSTWLPDLVIGVTKK